MSRLALLCVVLVSAALGWVARERFAERGDTASQPQTPGHTDAKTLWTCSMHPQVIQDHPGTCPICHMELTPLSASSQSGALAIDPVVVQSMGVRTVRVVRGGAHHTLRAFGTFVERTPDHRDVTLRVSGRLEELYASSDGQMLAKGEPLFALSSPELNVVIEELIAARKQRALESASSRALGETLYAAAHSRLELSGLEAADIDALALLEKAPAWVTFKSPMTGHALSIAGYAGSNVKAGDRILSLADNRKLWLDLRVPANETQRIVGGETVRAHVDGYPGETFDGILTFIHPHVEMESRTALVRVELDNPAMRLREGMWASADIEFGSSDRGLFVPREAVIDTGLRAIVFVALGEGRFEPHVVVTGSGADAGLIEIESGLEEGAEVVASGQFLLDSESRLREAVRKFLAPKADMSASAKEPRPTWASAVDPLVVRYLALADSLGQSETSPTALDASAFVAAARELARVAPGDARIAAVLKSAEPLVGAKLATQRELFKKTSDALLELVSHVPPSVAVGSASLYVMNCPMAPGRWLQRDAEVKNPFYATTMKACGELVRPLQLEPEPKR